MIRFRALACMTTVLVACVGGCHAGGGDSQQAEIAQRTNPAAVKVSSKPKFMASRTDDPLHPKIKIETTLGDMVFELDAQRAPGTVLYFMQNVFDKHYDGTVFHRVMKDTVIQAGTYTAKMVEKPKASRPPGKGMWNSPLTNKRGTIALLRGSLSGGGVGEFFINVADNARLDEPRNKGLFAPFGKVVDGQEVIDRIRNVPVSTHPQYAAGKADVVPVDPVIIKSIQVLGSFNAAHIQSVVQEQIEARKHAVEIKIAELEQQTGRKIVTAESGIQYIDLRIGNGPPVLITDTVMFNYEGSLADGSVFESTFVSEPKVLPVSGLIEGLREGILTINEGGSRFVIVPPELGYGEAGIPAIIPPDATLFYRIELLEIRPTP